MMTREQWGELVTVATKVAKHRLEWLGYSAWMPDDRIPEQTLFGWLPQPRPPEGPQRRWRDLICPDLKAVWVLEEEWYETSPRQAGERSTTRGWGIVTNSSQTLSIHTDWCSA